MSTDEVSGKKTITVTKVLALAALVAGNPVYAYTECPLTVSRVWVNYKDTASGGIPSVWVCFDQGGCIYKSESDIGQSQLDRLIATSTSAMYAGGTLFVRYMEDGFNCQAVGNRNDFQGFWIDK